MAETTGDLLNKLKRQEEKEVPGAPSRTPKQALLDASSVQAKHPDKYIRWVSLRDSNKIAIRQAEGYTVLPESEGGKRLGDELVLMAAPKKVHEQRVARQEEENNRRLNMHNADWEQLAESIAKTLRDQHGIKIDARTLMRAEVRE